MKSEYAVVEKNIGVAVLGIQAWSFSLCHPKRAKLAAKKSTRPFHTRIHIPYEHFIQGKANIF
jgi:hypothetical protein